MEEDNSLVKEKTKIEYEAKKIIQDEISPISSSTRYGLCKDCVHLKVVSFEFGESIAECYQFEIKLDQRKKVKECSCYQKRGTMNLWEMESLATIIDVNKSKIGF